MIEDLTINTGSQNNPDAFTQNFTTGTSNVNLRGLGVSSTLVLINGRRQTQSAVATDRGENFVDTSSLPPMIAFDRIELLKDGATALYGSEAVAGVVNFITRSELRRLRSRVRRCRASTTIRKRIVEISGLYGVGNDRTHLLVAFSYLDRDPLTTYDRRLSAQTDDLSQAGNPGSFLVPSLPGNPAFQSVWTAAFDTNRNGVADFVEPTLGLPAGSGRAAARVRGSGLRCDRGAGSESRAEHRGQRSEPDRHRFRSASASSTSATSTRSCPKESRAERAIVELTHELDDVVEGRVELHIADNEASAQQLAVVSVRGVSDRRRGASRQPVRQRRALHRPHHRRRRHRDREHSQLRHDAFRGLVDRLDRRRLGLGARALSSARTISSCRRRTCSSIDSISRFAASAARAAIRQPAQRA